MPLALQAHQYSLDHSEFPSHPYPSCVLPCSHLDNHSLWEPKVFATRCFKIIMYSIQVW